MERITILADRRGRGSWKIKVYATLNENQKPPAPRLFEVELPYTFPTTGLDERAMVRDFLYRIATAWG